MPSPTEDTWLRVAASFQDVANLSNCVGAVDGKHIRMTQPPHSSSKFYNYKKYFCIVLMPVADSQYKFVAIDIGAYGSMGDSRVLQTSEIGTQILRDGRMLPAPRALSGSIPPVPYVMVSDEAFPLMPNLLRPYPRRGLNARRRIFNVRLSRARRVVECAFGIMVSQWRVLTSAMQVEITTADEVVKACCVRSTTTSGTTDRKVWRHYSLLSTQQSTGALVATCRPEFVCVSISLTS
ncbi:DDE superfamily endonuclease [Pristimantis euphronides]